MRGRAHVVATATLVSIPVGIASSCTMPLPSREVMEARRFPLWRYQPPMHMLGSPPLQLATSRPSASRALSAWPAVLRNYQGKRA